MSKKVLCFHYDLKDSEGNPLDSSRKGEPFAVMEGSRQILPLLEKELFEMQEGDTRVVTLPATDAFGEFRENLQMKVPRSKLPEGEIKVGSKFKGGEDEHAPIFTVTAVDGDTISLDGNHPLAGKDLTFHVEVTEIREATEEEIAHGHAHRPGGHH